LCGSHPDESVATLVASKMKTPERPTASDVTDGERDLLALAQSCLHRKGEVEDMLDRQWLTETTPLDYYTQ